MGDVRNITYIDQPSDVSNLGYFEDDTKLNICAF